MRERPLNPPSSGEAFFNPIDPALLPVSIKVFAGERLTGKDGSTIFNSEDLASIGFLANYAREGIHGRKTTFSVNVHINYSNICLLKCRFCAFRRDKGEPGAYRLTDEEICSKIGKVGGSGPLEVHITGSLDPLFGLEEAVSLIKKIKKMRPSAVVKAFTLVEVDYFAKKANLSHEKVISKLKKAGVSTFPGGGAELFSPRVRKKICPTKISGKKWLGLAEKAHSMGVFTNSTMLYGIGETAEERVGHILKLRELQDKTNGFMSFIPLLFQKENTVFRNLRNLTALEQLKVYAVSRLLLDNFSHIKAHWIMSGLKVAELSQWFGVDDLEGTVIQERIGHEGGADTPTGMTRESVSSLIEKSGHTPVLRDGLYNHIKK